MKKMGWVFIALLSFTAQPALADWLGLAPGRSANLDNASNMSIDAGIRLNGDIRIIGTRFNFKASPDLLVFADAGLYDRGDLNSDGFTFGAGAMYFMRNLQVLENTDFAVRGVYHAGSLDRLDVSEFGATAIISGDQIANSSMGWYANAGIHIIKLDVPFVFGDVNSTEIVLGGGVTGSLAFGEWYVSLDLVDEILFGAGFRYNLN